MSSLLIFLLSAPAHAQCPDPSTLIDEARQAILEARMEDAGDAMKQAEEALGCSGLPTPELISRMWLTEGARLYFSGDEPGALRAFAAAARTDSSVWFEEFGQQLHEVYEEATQEPRGPGEILLEGDVPEGYQPALNGTPVEFPQTVVGGPHLIQILRPDGTAIYARSIMLPDDEVVEVRVGTLDPLPEPRVRRWGLLAASGVSAAAAGGMVLLAAQQTDAFNSAGSVDDLDQTLARQRLMMGSSYGLAALSVVGVGAFFVF